MSTMKKFVYEYDRLDRVCKEYYLAECEEDVYRRCFSYMYIDIVNKYFSREYKKDDIRHRHDDYSFFEIKDYLKYAGNAVVYLWQEPNFTIITNSSCRIVTDSIHTSVTNLLR